MSTINGGWRGPNIVTDGLIFLLDANSPTSYSSLFAPTTWKDISGNANNGTLTNGPTFNSSNGGSIVFDGVDDYVDLGTSTLLDNTINDSSNFTISYWIKCTLEGYVLDCGNIGNDPNNAFELRVRIISVNNIATSSTMSAVITLSNWNYITVTKNSSRLISWYLNGIFSNSDTLTTDFSVTNQKWKIGRRAFNNAAIFGGNIASLKIYNRTLSSTEILQNYNATRSRFGL